MDFHLLPSSNQLNEALERGAQRYFDDCRKAINRFTQQHYQYPGAWHTNKLAFGWDLLKMPLNVLWAPFFVCTQLLAWLAGRLNAPKLRELLLLTPSGFTTRVQRHTLNLINTQILGNTPSYNHFHFCINNEIVNALKLHATEGEIKALTGAIDPIIDASLNQYAITRTASADLTNTALSTILGALVFNKFTPGGIGFGLLVAAILAKNAHIKTFIFGETLGGWYYALFPPEPSVGLMVSCTFGVMCIFAVLASFAGLLSDPLQYLIGLHQYRLRRLIKHLEADFKQPKDASFKPKDQYIARLLDVLDALKTQL